MGQAPGESIHMRAIMGVFRRHLWAFLLPAAIVPLAAWIAVERVTPLYMASGSLIYDPSEYKGRELESVLRSDPVTEAVMASQAEILQSLKIAQRVAERGNLYADPEFNVALRPPSHLARWLAWAGRLWPFGADDADAPRSGPAAAAADPHARDLQAGDLHTRDLHARDLRARDLHARDLQARDSGNALANAANTLANAQSGAGGAAGSVPSGAASNTAANSATPERRHVSGNDPGNAPGNADHAPGNAPGNAEDSAPADAHPDAPGNVQGEATGNTAENGPGNVRGDARPQARYGPTPDAARDATVLAVRDALHAAPVRFSRVLEVTFTAHDPLVAAAAVNNAMDIYIKDQFTAKAAAVHRATRWLEERAAALRAEVRRADDRMATWRAEHDFARGMHSDLGAERMSQLNEDLIRARADLATADARLDAARGQAGAAAQAAIAASVVPLRTALEQLTARYQARIGLLGANHPEVEGSRRQVEDARRAVDAEIARVVTGTQQDRRAASERVTTLEHDLADAKQQADAEAKAEIPLNAMERDAEAARTQLLAVLERIQQTAQQHALETSEAHEISLALPPTRPSWPKPGPMLVAAAAAGLLLGAMAVYFLHLADTTLHSGADVRNIAHLPCFALVPELSSRELRGTPIDEYVVRRPLTAFAEQIRAVRAGLWSGIERPKVIAITAARPAEGKSMLALSIARSASLSGERVLLIDCDVRRPSLAHRLQADNNVGLVDLLACRANLEDVLHGDRFGGAGAMHFVPAGRPGTDTFGLFMGPEMARLLNRARQEYGLIVLDSPPVQAITEARVLAAVADATVLCVRWRATPRHVVSHTLELLEHAHAQLAGIVLTRVDPRAHVHSGYADAEAYHRRYRSYYAES